MANKPLVDWQNGGGLWLICSCGSKLLMPTDEAVYCLDCDACWPLDQVFGPLLFEKPEVDQKRCEHHRTYLKYSDAEFCCDCGEPV